MIRTAETSAIQQIISMENSGEANERPFQFRIASGALVFINITGGVQSVSASIPTSGQDAFIPNEWFHVAVTYNGLENTVDNIKLYWTRVEETRTEASELLSSSMQSDLAGVPTVLGVGNEYRNSQDNNLEGQIDEVRISNIARRADQFLFESIDSDNDGLSDLWEIENFRDNPSESDSVILAKYSGIDDPDGDGFDNEAEETARTDPGQVSISSDTRIGFSYQLKTSTDLLFSSPSIETLQGDGTWQSFGDLATDEPRRFWRIERVEESLNNF